MNILKIALSAATLTLPACMSTSFAPPAVNSTQAMTSASLSPACRLTNTFGGSISETVGGTIQLINNYSTTYDCAMRAAANGRQAFQVPAFLALVGSTAAVAFGAGPNVAIAGGAANSLFTAGGSYYAPAEQTNILLHALDAINCIRQVAVGSPAYTSLPAASAAERGAHRSDELIAAGPQGEVEISSEQQYFNMVKGALDQVTFVTGQRLSQRGTFDAAGVAAQIRALAQEERDRQQAADHPPATAESLTSRFSTRAAGTAQLVQMVRLQLAVMQPQLDQCVVRAKT